MDIFLRKKYKYCCKTIMEMKNLLDDKENLELLEELVSGNALSVNISVLSRILNKHRNTIKKKVENIFKYKIVDPPVFPFSGLYKVYPLLAVINLDIPDEEQYSDKVEKWVKEDPYIFAAFRSRQGEYDTLLFTYHENITNYQLWMLSIPSILKLKYGVSEEHANFTSSTSYFSNQLMIKYNPSTGINLMEADLKKEGKLTIRGYNLDELDLKILMCLVYGKGIKINISSLSKKFKLHRKTIDKRISMLLKARLISEPICRFPNFFVPPNYLLTYMLVDLKKMDEKFIRDIIMDPNIPIAIQTIHGKYNLLIFGNHRSIDDQLRWEEKYRKKFCDSFRSASITYLSPEMTISFSQQIVSLSYIRKKLVQDNGIDLGRTIQSLRRARAQLLYDHPCRAGRLAIRMSA